MNQPAPPLAPQPGDTIAGKYTVERVLGAGGMGVVLAALDNQLGRRVAIKVLHGSAAQDANAVGRFLREARAAVALTSEHAAKVIDVGTLPTGGSYMVMEYLAGADLGQVLERSGPLPIADAVGYVIQACEAIAEAHSLGIVHRDLKPANLFLSQRMDRSEIVKVLDFGISKATDGPSALGGGSLTATDAFMGSPLYMSPEQIRSARGLDGRSDVWSLGVVLYELLTGSCPFVGESLGDTLLKIAADPAPPISDRRPNIPAALAATIHGCLQRDLPSRIQSVSELATRLLPFAPSDAAVCVDRIRRMACQSEPTGPAQSSNATRAGSAQPRVETLTALDRSWPPGSGQTTSRRSRWLLLGLVAGVLLLGGAAFGLFRAMNLKPSEQPVAAHVAAPALPPKPMNPPLPVTPEPAPTLELEGPASLATTDSEFNASAKPKPGATPSSPSRRRPAVVRAPTPAVATATHGAAKAAPPPATGTNYDKF